MIETYKIVNNIDKTDKEIFKIGVGATTRGHKYKIFKPMARNNATNKSCR
jgi:hypothetical protein